MFGADELRGDRSREATGDVLIGASQYFDCAGTVTDQIWASLFEKLSDPGFRGRWLRPIDRQERPRL